MPGWGELGEFEPRMLVEALARIEQQHLQLLDPPAPSADRVGELREALIGTRTEEIPALAGRLDRTLLLASSDLLLAESEHEVVEKAVLLALSSQLKAIPRRAWKLSVEVHASAGLQSLLERSLVEATSPIVEDGDGLARLRAWFSRQDLPLAMMYDLESSGGDLEEWTSRLPRLSTPVGPDSPLADEVRSRLLTAAKMPTLLRFRDQLLPWVEELTEGVRASLPEDFSAHYLAELRPDRSWDESIVDWITERFGAPDPENQVAFWRRAEQREPEIVAELASWLALRKLRQFLDQIDDRHGRFEFWRGYFEDRFLDVKLLADGRAAMLRFPGVVVVEFGEVPNAAYVYPESALPWLMRRRGQNTDAYKDKERVEKRPSDGKPFTIHHIGNWQRRAYPEMTSLLDRRAQ